MTPPGNFLRRSIKLKDRNIPMFPPEKIVSYYTRVLSKDAEFPPFDELADFISSSHPDFKLTVEEGTEEEWESLLLSSTDEVEVALLERIPVFDEHDVAEFIEETQDCKPETGVQ